MTNFLSATKPWAGVLVRLSNGTIGSCVQFQNKSMESCLGKRQDQKKKPGSERVKAQRSGKIKQRNYKKRVKIFSKDC